MPNSSVDLLAHIEPFSRLASAERVAIAERLEVLHVERGTYLVRQGAEANRLFIVASGRFRVLIDGVRQPVADIRAGQPIGEIAFFAGGTRTADVRAQRDSVVLALSRSEFEKLAKEMPGLWPRVTATLAQRLAATTAARGEQTGFVAPRTITVCRAGPNAMHPGFLGALKENLAQSPGTLILDGSAAKREMVKGGLRDVSAQARWFNDLETQHERVVYICDDDLSAWSEKALRQADHVLLVGDFEAAGGTGVAPNELEKLAATLVEPNSIRLVLVHPRRRSVFGTARWLDARPFSFMHHHVAAGDPADVARLMRFVLGNALGLVASGGGAFTAAHIGMYEALLKTGHAFDILGGTSGGAAMAAAFASGVSPDEIDVQTHEMFVSRNAMGRWNWPRYSLLDHRVFDEMLATLFPISEIADMWVPYFAAATNLTRNTLEVIRRGPLWKAIRASAAIPALFPPVYGEHGEMLVDGCLIDNVPLGPMRDLKAGPNVVLELELPQTTRFHIDSATLPSRVKLLGRSFLPNGAPLPAAPGPQAVLLRSLLREQRDVSQELGSGDRLLAFPVPEGASVLDWSNHSQLRWAAYEFARFELDD